MKRITAIILMLFMCLSAVSCGDGEEVPEGMHSVSLESDPFILYVPKAWTANSVSGISGAYFSPLDKISTTARYQMLESEEQTLEEYVAYCIEAYEGSVLEFELDSREETVLCGESAEKLIYTFKDDDREYTSLQMITLKDDFAAILSFFCPTDMYDANVEQFEEIIDVFVIRDMPKSGGDNVTDKKTPEGMKIASSDKIEYRLYVPVGWVCSSESGRSEAYFSEDDRSNVTVTSFSPDTDMTPEEYFHMCKKEYEEKLAGYELLGEESRKISKRDAKSYTYLVENEEVTYKIMQTVVVRDGLVYSITYTATEDVFDSHMDDVEKILDAFIFR